MIDSVLRVFSDDFDVEQFLTQTSLSVPYQSYIKGQADLLGSPNLESGFDALISEAEDVADHIADIHQFINTNKALFIQLQQLKVSCVLDIGWTVAANDQFTQAVSLSTELLGLCHDCAISIEFSAYPEQG